MHKNNNNINYLHGSPYYMEDVLGLDLSDRAIQNKLTFLLLNQPPICNYSCRRCFRPLDRRGKVIDALSTKEYCSFVDKARKEDIRCLEISGEGEPLLSKSLKEIIRCANANDIITTIITNGYSLSKDIIEYFFKSNVTLIVSMYSINEQEYEKDNSLMGSYNKVLDNIIFASKIYKGGLINNSNNRIYRMALHTTAQKDNIDDLVNIKAFCKEHDIFFSIAPIAPTGGALLHKELLLTKEQEDKINEIGDNSIILSKTSKKDTNRQVCGTCLYGINIGYDGALLFDAHAGYEIGNLLGNIRNINIEEIIDRQRKYIPLLFQNIGGFCPIRDSLWPDFLARFMSDHGAR